MRRVLIILLIIVVVCTTTLFIYKKKHPSPTPTPQGTGTFFPTGENTIPSTLPITNNPPSTAPVSTTPSSTTSSPFKQLSAFAIAGYTTYSTTATTSVSDPTNPKAKPQTIVATHHVIRYVSRNNGYVYEITDDSVPLQISNIYIPNIYETVFGDNHQSVLLRFLRDDQRTIASYSVPIPPENKDGTRTQKEGVYFPDNTTQAVASPDSTQLARIGETASGSILTLSTFSNTKKIELLTSPLHEWILLWPSAKTLYLQTKASASVPGFLYKVDTTERRLRRVVGNVAGLTTSVSPSGTYIIYSESTGTSFNAKILNTKTNTVTPINLAILPEKCAWMKNEDLVCAGNSAVTPATYPDAWYMGTQTLSDQLYHIYPAAGIYDVLYNNTGQSFDMTNLSLDETRSMVYFMDKPTGLLWQFRY